ncbi:MAG: ABC transporter ATP-binding protein, partial [Proteobacteria bacterium]|nr:ABC transporter ATP-binding protein [Pseudomonadota bacterium]
PAVRHALWDKMRELKRSGTTIILTTHYMDEAELLCDRLVLIDQGKIKTQGSPKDLIREYCAGYLAVFYDENGNSKNSRRKEYASLEELSTAITLETSAPQVIRPANLEDVFLKLTGRDFEQYD